MRGTILSVSTNRGLLQLRNLVLTHAGYTVISARSGSRALKTIHSQALDAVIVGHSLSAPLKQSIVHEAKRRKVPVVVLATGPHEAPIAGADANLCGLDGAAGILDVLRQLLKQRG